MRLFQKSKNCSRIEMKKGICFLIFVALMTGCSPFKVHYVSLEIKNQIKKPFLVKVNAEPQTLKEELNNLVLRKLSLIASIFESEESGTIEVSFKTRQQLTTDKDGKNIFATTTEVRPKNRHIYQSSEMEFAIYDNKKNLIYKTIYRYEGRNDYKVDYLQTPEKAMEECLDRILERLKEDLK